MSGMRVLGVSSGTSVDAIDLAVAEFTVADGVLDLTPLAGREVPWPDALRADLLAVLPPAASDVATWSRLDAEVGRALGTAAAPLAAEYAVDLIASHGQTLHHWVDATGRARGTLQVGNPAWIHAATGVPVVHDLRNADIAAGGQGAPLASTLDTLWLGDVPTAALNLGGIANISVVGPDRAPAGGDTGPANCLLDAAAHALGLPADVDGALARAGHVDPDALALLLADPYYTRPLPKSTGREHFHAGYVADRLGARDLSGPDLFATLTELTARTVADAVNAQPGLQRVVASGGGLRNPALTERLEALLDVPLVTSDDLGLPSAAKEAHLFALLGWLSVHGLPGTVAGATGPHAPAVLGSLTPPVPPPTTPVAAVRRVRVHTQEDR